MSASILLYKLLLLWLQSGWAPVEWGVWRSRLFTSWAPGWHLQGLGLMTSWMCWGGYCSKISGKGCSLHILSRKIQTGVCVCTWLGKCPSNYFVSAGIVAFKGILGHAGISSYFKLCQPKQTQQIAVSKLVTTVVSVGGDKQFHSTVNLFWGNFLDLIRKASLWAPSPVLLTSVWVLNKRCLLASSTCWTPHKVHVYIPMKSLGLNHMLKSFAELSQSLGVWR